MAQQSRSLRQRFWYQCVRLSCHWLGAIFFRGRCTGMENIPREGGVLVVSNHQSHLDPPLIGGASWRAMNFVARETLFKSWVFGWLIRSLNAVPIDREGTGLNGIKEMLKRLKRGEMVLIFPEGTRTKTGEMRKFRPGFTTLATRGRATILPVAVEGAYDTWPPGKKFPGLGRIHIHYGKPITPDELKQYDDRELVELVEQRVRDCQKLIRERPAFRKQRERAETLAKG